MTATREELISYLEARNAGGADDVSQQAADMLRRDADRPEAGVEEIVPHVARELSRHLNGGGPNDAWDERTKSSKTHWTNMARVAVRTTLDRLNASAAGEK